MIRTILFFVLFWMFSFITPISVLAQADNKNTTPDTATSVKDDEQLTISASQTKDTVKPATTAIIEQEEQDNEEEPAGMHQEIKRLFIEGGPLFMTPILLCLLFGLAIAIERFIYLNLSSINTEKFINNVENGLNAGGIDNAKELCRNTRGPVASIFYQGLDRYDPSKENRIDIVEKTIIAYGAVQTGLLEKGLTWIALFISLAPMLGFLGTVIGMVVAFDAIEKAGDISPSLVAGGIKIALITTVGGLIVAMILQVAYNYIISKINSLINKMEDASISLIDILVKYEKEKY
ncbi:MAG: MotA/TolQ/ExbB proton channel family protein [Bacteroidia bacterium]|nr:MotA/TolQ/ExbB proton channel family protein [Bacteroidia bacterium]